MGTLVTPDGVRLRVRHDARQDHADSAADGGLAFVVGHGFTGSIDRPGVRAVVAGLRPYGGVVTLDFRGHGRSTGVTTVGDREITDIATAVEWARTLGYERIATVGFSMGGTIVIRHAALLRDESPVDAVVAVSAPAWWYFRGTPAMRRVHWLIERPSGRLAARVVRRTRVDPRGWPGVPREPRDVVGLISPTPLLIVHGGADPFLPVAHASALYEGAGEPRTLWVRPGMGHAEGAADAALLAEIGAWATAHTKLSTTVVGSSPGTGSRPAAGSRTAAGTVHSTDTSDQPHEES